MQPENSVSEEAAQDNLSLPIILAFILLVFFLLGFFSLYLCRHIMEYINSLRQMPTTPRGLPSSIISSFPTFTYSSVKNLHRENQDLECSVCLSEFSDDDVLRQLTGCSHVFHPACIDLWLETHTTCPVCRRNLDGNEKTVAPDAVIPIVTESDGREVEEARVDEICQRRSSFKEEEVGRGGGDEDMEEQRRHVELLVEGLQRSHSTGHSLILSSEEDGRFRLSDENRALTGRRSCAVLADISARA